MAGRAKTFDDAVEALRRGDTDTWNNFRSMQAGTLTIYNERFEGIRLHRVDLSNCRVFNSEFYDCDLFEGQFEFASFISTSFIHCDLSKALFVNCDFESAQFRDCGFDRARFLNPSGLTASQFAKSSDLETATLPHDLEAGLRELDEIPWDDDIEDQLDEDDEEERPSVVVDGTPTRVPRIPMVVPAPVEVHWVADRLVLHHYGHESLLGHSVLSAAIEGYKKELSQFLDDVRGTNLDQRIATRIQTAAGSFPDSASEFSEQLFKIWYQLKPVFTYAKITQSDQPDYIRARFIVLEGDLRDILGAFPAWREYEAIADSLRMSNEFDVEKLRAAEKEFLASLQKFPDNIDRNVVKSIESMIDDLLVNVPVRPTIASDRDEIHAIAASSANVVSRILKRLVNEVAAGGLEGVRDTTKLLVSTVMVGGGGTLVWLITSGLHLFDWLGQAWLFVRMVLKI